MLVNFSRVPRDLVPSEAITREIKLLCGASFNLFCYPSAFIYPLIKITSIYLDWCNFVLAGFVNWDPQGNLPVFQSQEKEIEMVSDFPNEVQENIFKHLDAENLMRVKKVCRRWNEIILKMEQMGDLWLDYCLLEVPSYILTDITKLQELSVARAGNIYHHVLSKLGWIFWKETFKEYMRTRRIKRDLYVVTNVKYSPHYGQVTALAFNDLLLYSGFENGDVCLWKNIDACQISTKVTDTIHCPVQAIYCDPKGTTISKLQGQHQKTESLMVVYKDKVRLYRNESKAMGPPWQWKKEVPRKSSQYPCEFCSIPVGGGDVWFEWYSGGYVYSVSDKTEKRRMENDMSAQITAADSSNRKVVCGSRTGDVFSFTLAYTCGFERTEHLSDFRHLGNVGSSVRQVITKGQNVLCLTDDSDILVSDGSSIFYRLDAHAAFGSHVECIAWHASILVIGTKYGIVRVYHVPAEKDILDLDLNNCSVIQLNCEHVNAIAIGDDGSRPVVAVATDTLGVIYIIRW